MEGSATTFAFGTKEVLNRWSPMWLPMSRDIEQIVADIEGEHINFGMNVAFIGQKRGED